MLVHPLTKQVLDIDHPLGELKGMESENFIIKPHCPNRHLGNKKRTLKFLVNTFRDFFVSFLKNTFIEMTCGSVWAAWITSVFFFEVLFYSQHCIS